MSGGTMGKKMRVEKELAYAKRDIEELREALGRVVEDNARLREQVLAKPNIVREGQGAVFIVDECKWPVVVLNGCIYVLSPKSNISLQTGEIEIDGSRYRATIVAEQRDVPRMDIKAVRAIMNAAIEAEAMED